ncbi:MAG TPA: hypothetical protein VK698_28085 [Kofleriaceae bacterium]|nr:hypothetical protein [Kofleriaceae bacterium]
MRIRPSYLVPASIVAAVLAACSSSAVPGGEDEAGLAVDEQAILSTLGGFRTSPGFVAVNQNEYETALGTGAAINVFVSAQAFAAYGSIDAEATGSGVTVPEGTFIVREVLEQPGGKVKTLTLMFKGPAGYNPELGDFWFGVTDPEGAVLVENGLRKAGRLEECYGCHLPRAEDGFLFGVPGSNRAGATPPGEPPADEPPPDDPPPDEPPAPPVPVCGDFSCDADEDCASCTYDCGVCPDPDDDDHGGDDDDHGGDDDDHGGGDDDHGGDDH